MARALKEWIDEPTEFRFHPEITKILYEPALIGVVFGYWDRLLEICYYNMDKPNFIVLYMVLGSYPLSVYIKNGCLTITNDC